MYELVFLTGARAGQVVPVNKTLLAGRSPECSLEVPDPNASRQHSRFVFDGQSVTVVDNGSSNGTYVNDQRIKEHRLQPDDVVRLGETRLRFQASSRSGSSHSPSSIFGFKDADEDLSQSILVSFNDIAKRVQSPEVLSQRLQAITQVARALGNTHKVEALFERILDTLFEVFPQVERGFLMTGKEVGKLHPAAVKHRGGKGATEGLSVSNTICRQALEQKGAVLFDKSGQGGDVDQNMSIVSLRIRSAMVVPLLVNDEVLGLLQVDTADRNRAFTKDDLELALTIAQQAAIALNAALLLRKTEEQATMRNNLMRFLPGPVAQQVLDGQLDFNLGGRSCKGTILFSDLIGFTALSETLQPEQVVTLMNGYFARMVPCIQGHAGSVDKFMGDAIMAVWGVPIDKGDGARNAVQAALAMQNALVGFNSQQESENGPRVQMGIGVNSGHVTAGNIGYDQRIEYTVLGDAVNTAQRLEHHAGRGQVLVSAATWDELAGAGYGVAMPPLKVKNKVEPVSTSSLRGLKVENGEVLLHLPVTSAGVSAWIIRRLADGTFLVLHPAECEICAHPLRTACAEWPNVDLGVPVMESVLPGQTSDGILLRSQVRLGDGTLAGLLTEKPIACTLEWDAMQRSGGGGSNG